MNDYLPQTTLWWPAKRADVSGEIVVNVRALAVGEPGEIQYQYRVIDDRGRPMPRVVVSKWTPQGVDRPGLAA